MLQAMTGFRFGLDERKGRYFLSGGGLRDSCGGLALLRCISLNSSYVKLPYCVLS